MGVGCWGDGVRVNLVPRKEERPWERGWVRVRVRVRNHILLEQHIANEISIQFLA